MIAADQLRDLLAGNANLQAFARVVRLGETDPYQPMAYRALYGWSAHNPTANTFAPSTDHPRVAVQSAWGWTSAAGAYQAMAAVPGKVKTDTWGDYCAWCKRQNWQPAFDPAGQDHFFAWCVARRGALDDVLAGRIDEAIKKCALEWASLPGSPYGQPRTTIEQCRAMFVRSGGTLAETVNPPPAEPAPEPTVSTFSDVVRNPATAGLLSLVNPLLGLVPQIASLFTEGGKTVPERNVAAAVAVADAAQRALAAAGKPADNMQQVVETIAADPEAQTIARAAILSDCGHLIEAGGGGIEGARRADVAFAAGGGRLRDSPSFLVALALLPLVYMIVANVVGVMGKPLSDEVRSAIANGVVGLILGGLIGYYYGQTTSRNRTPAP